MADHLAANVMHFARVLREAGLRVGTDRVQLALEALQVAGLESRHDFKAVLAACLIDRAEHRALFEQAFTLFWRDPDLLGRVMALLLPRVQGNVQGPPPPENRRLAGALFPHAPVQQPGLEKKEEDIEIEAHLSWSEKERLQQRDFETMTAEEWSEARRVLARMRPFLKTVPTRRRKSAHRGRIDWRATLRAQARGNESALRFEKAREKLPPLVILADISGSMSRYSRMLLHLAHGLANPQDRRHAPRVSSFVFGTRLTPITRLLEARDPDLAVAGVSRAVADWSGGTRLAACLHDFNKHWARRVLGSDATVLLVTDGLEHGDAGQLDRLGFEARRLRLSCRRLVWLNPLLRFEGFEPRAAGVRALLPEVTLHIPAHNLASLHQLQELLCN